MTQPTDDAEVVVKEAPDKYRFEIWVGDALAGFTTYRKQPGTYTYVHTEIDPAFGGRGLASVLIKAALDEMRARGAAVLPQCPFVRRYISRHEEYLDLVPAQHRNEYDLPEVEQ
jgi:predicted GNAT family acetyltransferase